MTEYVVRPIGRVESVLRDKESAPRQGDEGAPDAWLVFGDEYRDGLRDLRPDTDILLLTWLDRVTGTRSWCGRAATSRVR